MTTHDTGDYGGPATLGERLNRFIGVVTGDPIARADRDMLHVLDALKALSGPDAIEDQTPATARSRPSMGDAVRAVVAGGGGAAEDDRVTAHDILYPATDGDLPARIYRPSGPIEARPIVLFFHAGGFVLGDPRHDDPTPRAIAAKTGAVVVAAGYRLAPEHKFPAAHEDAVEAYRWIIEEAEALGGDAARVAVAGESAGGNLALNVAIAARDLGLPAPAHVALICPMVGVDMETPSYAINEHAAPLNKAAMGWFLGHALPEASAQDDPRMDLIGRAELSGLPPVTIVTAEIDPLRWEGHALAEKMSDAGCEVNALDFEGVTHGFFAAGAVVRDARLAQDAVARDLRAALEVEERWARVCRAM